MVVRLVCFCIKLDANSESYQIHNLGPKDLTRKFAQEFWFDKTKSTRKKAHEKLAPKSQAHENQKTKSTVVD